jgi:insertion element IS1 protein InsB
MVSIVLLFFHFYSFFHFLDPFRQSFFCSAARCKYTDGWGAYERHIEPALHEVGKYNTQKIERKHLTLRTRIKRLARKTICFSKSIVMHDIVLGLFINRFEFGCLI